MPYLNIDDGFADHPKVDDLSDGAFRLHVAALCACAKGQTDGFIRSHKVPRLTHSYRPTLVVELVEAGLWHEADDGWDIHDFLDWNKPKSWWDEKRARDAERKAKWREKKVTDR
ncbi:hypothetical protein [Aeromicrobium piscarium]|uniref:Uncharacterized protein n=1 Tax=Aeromicrobium piscarium TaxID=2590901 RepID=A0A554SP23_9ACTN|nr:hypothetical protein [Aeromicrobium piscarium]TSD68104.1 hypothetical protein FNM00_00470 [Aeromicrobium piscarium]